VMKISLKMWLPKFILAFVSISWGGRSRSQSICSQVCSGNSPPLREKHLKGHTNMIDSLKITIRDMYNLTFSVSRHPIWCVFT
jgi:hypothetical protein